jgi:hypothetical protein
LKSSLELNQKEFFLPDFRHGVNHKNQEKRLAVSAMGKMACSTKAASAMSAALE